MKFLVILVCLIINYLWLKDFDRFDDSWFFRFRCRMKAFSTQISSNSSLQWTLGIGFTYLIPLFTLTAILYLLTGQFFDLPTMLIHILVLLVALDRIQPGKLTKGFLEKWIAGDIQACVLYLEQELAMPQTIRVDDEESLSDYFGKQLVYRSFERMFVMFFWYMLAGPIGILICYISYQLRDTQSEPLEVEVSEGLDYRQHELEAKLITNVIWLLEWVPMRLLAITFSLAGNFVHCFENLKNSFWATNADSSSADLLYGYANCALAGKAESDSSEEDEDASPTTRIRLQKAARIQALLALLERSQAVWLILLAVLTVYA